MSAEPPASAPPEIPGVLARVDVDQGEAAAARRVVLDVRDASDFVAGHLPGAGNVPRAELAARRSELPERRTPILVVADTAEEARAAAEALIQVRYRDVAWLDAPAAGVARLGSETGPGARLWSPAPFLARVLPRLPKGRAADIAAGHGRDAVFLALNGFAVEAWDDDANALDAASALAERCGTAITPVVCDLERHRVPLTRDAYDVIAVFRFLHRPLFGTLERALKPGGMLVYETFRVGQERFGRPYDPRHLLLRGELGRAFPLLDVLEYEEHEAEGGPVTARLLARRP